LQLHGAGPPSVPGPAKDRSKGAMAMRPASVNSVRHEHLRRLGTELAGTTPASRMSTPTTGSPTTGSECLLRRTRTEYTRCRHPHPWRYHSNLEWFLWRRHSSLELQRIR
jgi:hypothetical protein